MLHISTPFKVYNHIAVYPLDYNYAEHLKNLQIKSLSCFTTHPADISRTRSIPVTREVSPSRADEGPTDEKSKLGQVRMI